MPRIGMRIIKSSVAVFLCFLIAYVTKRGIPFYSAIAAILCMQPAVSHSIKVALNRTVGTFIGGVAGMLVLWLMRSYIPPELELVNYLVVSLCVIPLIYTTVAVKKSAAAYITCVVFLSVTVSHGIGVDPVVLAQGIDVSPFAFGLNRILDTLVGIFVSLAVNWVRLPCRKQTGRLLVADLESALADAGGGMDDYTRVRLNRLREAGARLCLISSRLPSEIIGLFGGAPPQVPVVLFDGAAVYDLAQRAFSFCRTLGYDRARELCACIKQGGHTCFVYCVIHDTLHIYYTGRLDAWEEKRHQSRQALPLEHEIYGDMPQGMAALCVESAGKETEMRELKEQLLALPGQEEFTVAIQKAGAEEYRLRVFQKDCSVETAVSAAAQDANVPEIFAWGSEQKNAGLLQWASAGYPVSPASAGEKVVKEMEKYFYHRKRDQKVSSSSS